MYRIRNSNSKYHASSTEYNGRVYHSKFEAQYARDLDLMIKAKKVIEWTPQVKISLDVNGYHICNYICDFKVIMKDGSIQLHEVKGFETDMFRMKRKLLEATYLIEHPEIKYIIIK